MPLKKLKDLLSSFVELSALQAGVKGISTGADGGSGGSTGFGFGGFGKETQSIATLS